MLPKSLASKLSSYVVCDAKVKVHMINLYEVPSSYASDKLLQFKQTLSEQRIVALDLIDSPLWLLLCTAHNCLMIKLRHQDCYYKREGIEDPFLISLDEFFRDQTICFAVLNNSLSSKKIAHKLRDTTGLYCQTDLDVRYLAAKYFRNDKSLLSLSSIGELGLKVGLDVKPRNCVKNFYWSAKLFNEEDIGYAIYNVYYSYLIAHKVVDSL